MIARNMSLIILCAMTLITGEAYSQTATRTIGPDLCSQTCGSAKWSDPIVRKDIQQRCTTITVMRKLECLDSQGRITSVSLKIESLESNCPNDARVMLWGQLIGLLSEAEAGTGIFAEISTRYASLEYIRFVTPSCAQTCADYSMSGDEHVETTRLVPCGRDCCVHILEKSVRNCKVNFTIKSSSSIVSDCRYQTVPCNVGGNKAPPNPDDNSRYHDEGPCKYLCLIP